jgi:predicted lipoprotein with Yx(FWY)xxD motif
VRRGRLRRAALVAPAAIVLCAVAFAACGNAGNVTTLSAPPTTDASLTLTLQKSPAGQILATGGGDTLYDFVPDTPTHSACLNDGCVFQWPPLVVDGPIHVGQGVDPSLVGTLKRPDGATQVSYGGHPLYTYNLDVTPGMVTGQAIDQDGGLWYVINPAGKQITTSFSVGTPNQNPNT